MRYLVEESTPVVSEHRFDATCRTGDVRHVVLRDRFLDESQHSGLQVSPRVGGRHQRSRISLIRLREIVTFPSESRSLPASFTVQMTSNITSDSMSVRRARSRSDS